MSRGLTRALALAGVAAVILLAIFFPEMDYPGRTLGKLHDFAHVPLFAMVAVGLAVALPGRRGRALGLILLLRIWLAALLAGILVELGQAQMGRFPELSDVVADGAGAAAGLLVLAGRGWPRRWRGLGAALAVAIHLVFLAPVAATAWDEAAAHRQFPVIADFESPLQLARFARWRCELTRLDDPQRPGNHLLQARFLPDEYPRFSLRDMPADWSGRGKLRFTCINPGTESFWLVLRINDVRHDNRPANWFTLRMDLAPGRHDIEVPLERVAAAPAGRAMDMAALGHVILYSVRLRQPATLLFDDFRLEP